MEHKPVKSSNIKSIGYDPASKKMQVRFSSGATYEYLGVTVEEHFALVGAESIGAHFAKHIRPRYQGVKLQEATVKA